MSEEDISTTKRKYNRKAKIFGVFATDADGNEHLVEYVEHYSAPQARTVALEGRIEVREAGTDELIAIGRDGTPYRKLADASDDGGQRDLYKEDTDQGDES